MTSIRCALPPRVGLFWVVGGRAPGLIVHLCDNPEPYADLVTCPHGHYALWQAMRDGAWRPPLWRAARENEYEDWPRGRIVHDPRHRRSVIYSDRRIIRAGLIGPILARFALPLDSQIRTDAHYVSRLHSGIRKSTQGDFR